MHFSARNWNWHQICHRMLDLDRDGVLDFATWPHAAPLRALQSATEEEFYSWISEDDCDMTRAKAVRLGKT